jgi:uncharacterized protein (DUF1501 family)
MAALRGFGITGMLFDNRILAATLPPDNRDLLVYVFVRGGMDGLNVCIPFNTSGADHQLYYSKLRPKVNIPAPNSNAPRRAVDLDGRFALHPDAARGTAGVNVPNPLPSDTGGLYKIFEEGDLAIVHAAGSPNATGSHFDTELYVDLGRTSGDDGWLTRYLTAINAPSDALIVAPQRSVPMSLAGTFSAVAVAQPDRFGADWSPDQDPFGDALVAQQRALMEPMFRRGNDLVSQIGQRAFQAYDTLHPVLSVPYDTTVSYLTDPNVAPDGGTFGNAMKTIARLAKADLAQPLRVASVDVGGGYDTHDHEGTVDWDNNPRFPQLITNLANNLKAFYDDMNRDPQWRGHFTVVVLSEFGRMLYENDSGGCDHGSGNVMFVLGSNRNINGGQIYADWPGLDKMGFNDGLLRTTDYRLVLSDILFKRMGATKDQINAAIFPGLNFTDQLNIAAVAK